MWIRLHVFYTFCVILKLIRITTIIHVGDLGYCSRLTFHSISPKACIKSQINTDMNDLTSSDAVKDLMDASQCKSTSLEA